MSFFGICIFVGYIRVELLGHGGVNVRLALVNTSSFINQCCANLQVDQQFHLLQVPTKGVF